MKVKAWSNGSNNPDGNGYGLKINSHDRDNAFRHDWKTIFLDLEGESSPVEININKPSFWNKTCRELISVKIGKWLIKNGLAPCEKGHPPEIVLEQIDGNRFRLVRSC